MNINSVSSMNFASSKIVNKTVEVVAQAADTVSKRSEMFGDIVTSTGADHYVTKNVKGETVKIASLSDVVKALGINVSTEKLKINECADNFIMTPYGKVSCMEDAVNISRKLKG